jgi:hypothetical protein
MATFKGPPPSVFFEQEKRKLIQIANEELAQLETELVEATPSDTGNLRQGWTIVPLTDKRLTGFVGQSKVHFLPVEIGRKPGSGISAKGQQSVATWAKRKLGLSAGEAKSFAYLLSRKYKAQGRPAVGFAGLANPGAPGGQGNRGAKGDFKPVSGGLIAKSFERLERRLTFR